MRGSQRFPEKEEESDISKDLDWITTRVAKARKACPTVTEAVSTRVEELLRGELAERELSGAKLKSIAEALMADTVPQPPKTG
jgi:hypothetical protein